MIKTIHRLQLVVAAFVTWQPGVAVGQPANEDSAKIVEVIPERPNTSI